MRGPCLRWMAYSGSSFEPALIDKSRGNALRWTTMFKLVSDVPVLAADIERMGNRPAMLRARKKDAAPAAAQAG